MLKFIEKGQSRVSRPLVAYHPSHAYGHSVQSPRQFQTPHSLLASDTYLNPYLKIQPQRVSLLPLDLQARVNPSWTYKVSPHAVDRINPAPQAQVRSNQQLIHDRRFHLTKGQFTDFLNKHKDYGSLGPIHGDERSGDRIDQTKSMIFSSGGKTSISCHGKMGWNRGKQLKLLDSSVLDDSKILSKSIQLSEYYNGKESTMGNNSMNNSMGNNSMGNNSMNNSMGNNSMGNNSMGKSTHMVSKNSTQINPNSYSMIRSGVIKKSIERERIRGNRLKSNHLFAEDIQKRKKHNQKTFYFPKITPGQIQAMGFLQSEIRYDAMHRFDKQF